MDIKIIKNSAEYDAAFQRLSELLDNNPEPGSKEDEALELLILVIQDYERKMAEPSEIDPRDAILFRMDQMNLTRNDLVPYMGSLSRVSEVLSGKRALSLSMIRKLNHGLEIPLRSLINTRIRSRKKMRRKQRIISRRKRSVRSK